MIEINDTSEIRLNGGYIYVATPYTKYQFGIEQAYMDACDISTALFGDKISHFCPIAYCHMIAKDTGLNPLDHDFWLGVERPFMEKAEACLVIGMDGWENSYGITQERAYFGAAEKPIYFADPCKVFGWIEQ